MPPDSANSGQALIIGRWEPNRRCHLAPQWMRLQIYGLGADHGELIVAGNSSRADRNRGLASNYSLRTNPADSPHAGPTWRQRGRKSRRASYRRCLVALRSAPDGGHFNIASYQDHNLARCTRASLEHSSTKHSRNSSYPSTHHTTHTHTLCFVPALR
jgi:hypothetical protein